MLRTIIYGRLYGATVYAGTAVLTALLVSISATLHAADYPIVFTSTATVRGLGISVATITSAPRHFQNKCYFYGEGGYLVSISNEFLARFKHRGFTVQSVCLGLVSETRYDPETGYRLPSYIIADKEAIAKDQREHGEIVSFGAVTEELPLDLPDCFRNGAPYSDCKFRFGRKTGKALSAAETDIYAQLGAALDKKTRALIAAQSSQRSNEFLDDTYGSETRGFRRIAGEFSDGSVQERLQRYSSATFWARSLGFPRGYGYALDADGSADPSVSPATVKTAIEGLVKIADQR
jgi:hypothetical protein